MDSKGQLYHSVSIPKLHHREAGTGKACDPMCLFLPVRS